MGGYDFYLMFSRKFQKTNCHKFNSIKVLGLVRRFEKLVQLRYNKIVRLYPNLRLKGE